MLITASWVERVKSILGLQGVSQIWCETPAWYFWLADVPGAYELRLEPGDDPAVGTEGIITGLFTVRFFPRATGWAFLTFSREERNLISSELFDETNTLRLEARECVHPHLFTIATIGISLSEELEGLGLFTLEAPEVSVWRVQSPARPDGDRGEVPGRSDHNGVTRRVPAWHLARRLFDCLVSLHAFAANTRPGRVVVTSSAGFDVVRMADGTITTEDTLDGSILTESVLFDSGGEEVSRLSEVLDRETAQPDGRVILDWKAACQCHNSPPVDASTYVSEHWWSIADAKRVSHLGSTCGCH
jgi:hypothetical protein